MTPQLIVLLTGAAIVVAAAGSPSTPSPSKPSPAPKPETLEDAARRLDVIMNNTRSRENYIRCFMDRGICNKEANAIKKVLGDALSTNCTKCTDRERAGAARFVEYLKSRQPETWLKMKAKYGGEAAAASAKGGDGGKSGAAAAAKGKSGPGAAAKPDAGNATDSDTDEDEDEDDDDDDEGEKKAKGDEKGKRAKNSTSPAPAKSPATTGHVSIIF